MPDDSRHPRAPFGPFGLGWQGYLLIAVIVVTTVVFAATRQDWTSILIAALLPPLILFPLIVVLTRTGSERAGVGAGRAGHDSGMDLLTFLARTNPIMFLLFGTVTRNQDDEQYRRLLGTGPYTMGSAGYLFLAVLCVLPLIVVLVSLAATGHLPTHSSP